MTNMAPPPVHQPIGNQRQMARPLSNQTQQMQQNRMFGIIGMLLILGPFAVILGAIELALATGGKNPQLGQEDDAYIRRKQRGIAFIALAGVIGMLVLVLFRDTLISQVLIVPTVVKHVQQEMKHTTGTLPIIRLFQLLQPYAPGIGWIWLNLWIELALLGPMVALFIDSSRIRSVEELEYARQMRHEAAAQEDIKRARIASSSAPTTAQKQMVMGIPIHGDLTTGWRVWQKKQALFTYPPTVLGRHLVIIGGSGTGKTETSLRLAYGTAVAYKWRILYLDCKGDEDMARRFMDSMKAAGLTTAAFFPEQAYDGWRGDAVGILNRLLTIVDYTEPYYRDMTKMILDLAVNAPPGPPRSSTDLLQRLNAAELIARYKGRPEANEVHGIKNDLIFSTYNRYRAFFRALEGGLDGTWAFEDVQAGYVMLKGLELKDQTTSIGRFIMEDFAHFVAKRKDPKERVLFIIDEFPAIAFGGANAATLFEMVRSKGAGVVVTAQSYAGMGEGVDRILGAAAGLLLHQCGDPDELLPRAGIEKKFQRSVRFTERGVSANPRSLALGEGSVSQREELKIHPNQIKELPPGECFLISGGKYQHISVSRLPLSNQEPPKLIEMVDRPARLVPLTIQQPALPTPQEPAQAAAEAPLSTSDPVPASDVQELE